MPRNTRIQFRRGLSSEWVTNTILAPGEIGFELDTGKFKIGATGLGLTTGSFWGDLPYAGGSALISNTGIGFKFNDSNNAYTLYSYITGITGGQDGITFQTLPLSGLLNDTSVSGTYYTIGLSTKLENFHDSNINISGNLISSSTAVNSTGIIISGFNNSAISLNPFGGTVSASGIDIRNITEGITVTSTLGGLPIGTSLTTSSGITNILKKILEVVYEPTNTGNDVPSLSIAFSGSPTATVEAGTVTNLTITATFNQGTVRGTGIGAGWVANGNQGVRAGAATSYVVNGNSTGTSRSFNIGNVQAIDGAITYNGANSTVTHGTGIVPKNSLGVNSTVLTQLGIDTISAGNNLSYTGQRNLFYGTSTSVLDPPSSGFIRTLNPLPNPSANTKFTMTIPVNTRTVIVAVPSGSTYASVANSSFGVKNNSTQLGVNFSSTGISIPGSNNYSPIVYKVWYLTNDGPLETSVNYSVALNGVFS